MARKRKMTQKQLEKLFPDEELRKLGREFGTKRRHVDYTNICRVVPADYINFPELLEMPKERKIYPETMIKEMYAQVRLKLNKLCNKNS